MANRMTGSACPPLPGEKVHAAEQLIKAGMTPGQAPTQLGIMMLAFHNAPMVTRHEIHPVGSG